MNTDWMPHTRSAQLAMAKRWMSMLPSKVQAWRIPEGMVHKLGELTSDAEILQDRADNPEGTKGDAVRVRTAFHELVAHMRDIRRRYFFMPPLTESNFADLGLQPPDNIRTPHIDVSEMVDFVIHLSNIRELVVDFWIQGEARKAKCQKAFGFLARSLRYAQTPPFYSWSFARGKTPKLSGVAG